MTDIATNAFGDDALFRRQRRALLMASATLTGVDFVELVAPTGPVKLMVHFVPSRDPRKPAIPKNIKPADIAILPASETRAAVYAAAVHYPSQSNGTILTVELRASMADLGGAEAGFAFLEIQDVESIDPLFARAKFALASGKGGADPLPKATPGDDQAAGTAIDYLAKDYQSFLTLMSDHLAMLMPDWHERHAADIGNAMVEVLAYAADYLSYYQDAVATEAYLETARRRVSLRRHARLLDYPMHEGCTARVWLCIEVIADCTIRRGLRAVAHTSDVLPDGSFHLASTVVPPQGAVFETIEDAALRAEHYRMPLYSWGLHDFRLRAGATSAALLGRFPNLRKGDVLIFAPGMDAGSDPSAESAAEIGQAVRLTRPPRLFRDPLTASHLTEIVWGDEDALTFDIPVPFVREQDADKAGNNAWAAWGNIVAADAGFTMPVEELTLEKQGGQYIARLQHPGLVYAVPYRSKGKGARAAAEFGKIHPYDAVPAVQLETFTRRHVGDAPAKNDWVPEPDLIWWPRPDLLASDRYANVFVAETDNEGMTTLRFGDDEHGAKPPPDTQLHATYRIGIPDRNIGANSIRSWVPRPEDADFIRGMRNPLPAVGGVLPQPSAEIRRDAPEAFHSFFPCAAEPDYVAALKTDPRVQAAVAQTRWIGSRRCVFIHVQRLGAAEADRAFLASLEMALDERRILGADFVLHPPAYVPLQIELTISVASHYSEVAVRHKVIAAVENLYRAGQLSFGDQVYLSPLIACAMEIPGVADVRVDAFHRFGKPPLGEREAGVIEMGPTEIARLDNRPERPDRGRLVVRARAVVAAAGSKSAA
jgi:hypothetical protein